MKKWIALASLSVLLACGVDGEPIPPGQDALVDTSEEETDETVTQNTPTTTTSTSTVVSVGSSGVYGGVATTVHRGNVSITLGTGF